VLIEVACMTNQGQTTLSKPSKITSHKCLNKYPFMVRKKVHQQLLEDGFKVSLNSQPLKTTQQIDL
jgi:hypothetical protein